MSTEINFKEVKNFISVTRSDNLSCVLAKEGNENIARYRAGINLVSVKSRLCKKN